MLSYMLKNNLPKELQMKVRMWFAYNWEHQKTLGEQLKTTIVFSIKRHAQATRALDILYRDFSMSNAI